MTGTRNPLSPLVRFGLYVLASVIGLVVVALTTRDAVATLAAAQTALLTLAAGKVDLR